MLIDAEFISSSEDEPMEDWGEPIEEMRDWGEKLFFQILWFSFYNFLFLKLTHKVCYNLLLIIL